MQEYLDLKDWEKTVSISISQESYLQGLKHIITEKVDLESVNPVSCPTVCLEESMGFSFLIY